MHLPRVLYFIRHLLLVILCLSTLWLITPCLDLTTNNTNDLLCLGSKKHTKQKNFSPKAMAETAQRNAYLSPVVFLGTLRSVLLQRDGTIRAWFTNNKVLKASNDTSVLPRDLEVVYYRGGEDRCVLQVNQDNLKLGSQYLVFGVPDDDKTSWPSFSATALPIPNDRRTLRVVRRIVCKDCAKPPNLSGLQRVHVEEGKRVRLNCHLAGYPIPWVEWYKNGTKVTGTSHMRVKTKRRTSRLIIRKASASDRGVYECRAGNIVQGDPVSTKATVTVTRKKTKTTKRPFTTTTTPPTSTSTTQSNPWSAEKCPRSDFCLNGGTCLFYRVFREYACQCAEGYIGLRCDYKDVNVSVGSVKNKDPNLFTDILILFVIFFCLNWAAIGVCWCCCFRGQRSKWKKFQKIVPLRKFFRSRNSIGKEKHGDITTDNVPSPTVFYTPTGVAESGSNPSLNSQSTSKELHE